MSITIMNIFSKNFTSFIFTLVFFQTSQVFSVSHVNKIYRGYSLNNPNTYSDVTHIGQLTDSDVKANVKLSNFDVTSIGQLSYSDVTDIGQLSDSDVKRMLHRVKPRLLQDGESGTTDDKQEAEELFLNPYVEDRKGRHFTTFDACANSVCDQVLRQAHSLGRIKLLREYIKDTVSMLDRLVTSVDSQLVTAGETLSRAVGSRCRAVHSVLKDITSVDSRQSETRESNHKNWYPVK